MLKNSLLLITTFIVVFCNTSCLDERPEDAIPPTNAISNYTDAEEALTGIYSSLLSPSLYSGRLTLLPDIQADLVYAVDGFSNTYGNIWQWDILTTDYDIQSVYAALYTVIGRCNFLLDNIDIVIEKEIDDTNITYMNYFKGEAYAVRALAYSELLKCFCKAYDPDTAEEELGVVLITTTKESEPVKRATLKTSYQFVLDDLDRAITLLDEENDAFGLAYFSKAGAQALYARIALYMKDWNTAVSYSTKLIDNKTFELSDGLLQNGTSGYDYYTFMWLYDNAFEIIMRIEFTATNMGGALGSVFMHNEDFVNFYPDYIPAQSILNLYNKSDIRYQSFFKTVVTGYTHKLSYPLLFKYQGNPNITKAINTPHYNMPKILRLSEQYLIRAEAYCNLNDFNKANTDLNKLRSKRGVNYTNATKENWLDVISDERARELFMEGFRLHDLKRWEKGFERKEQRNTLKEGSILKINADDYRFVWPIPNHEVNAPGSEVLQNTGY